MPTPDLYCDQFGRPPPRLRSDTWRDRQRLQHERREMHAGLHADWRERAEILTCILIDEAGTRLLTEADVNQILGLDPRQLENGTMSTPLLHEALAHMRRQPHVR